jgi:hypothetical protein
LACTAPAASGTGVSAGTSNGDRRRSKAMWRAHTREETSGLDFMGGRPCLRDVPTRTAVPRGGGGAGTRGGPVGNSQCGRRRMRGSGGGGGLWCVGGACSLGKARGGLRKVRRQDSDAEAAGGPRRGARGALAGATSRRGVVPSANVLT